MNLVNSILSADPSLVAAILFALTTLLLSFYIFSKLQIISILKRNMDYLNQTVQDLDHQAKIIIRSDMELKLYQEEIDDKLNKLSLLKNMLLSSLYVLDRNQLFSQVNEKTINDLGFQKGLIVGFSDSEVKVNINFNPLESEELKKFVTVKKEVLKTISLLTSDSETSSSLIPLLSTKNFLIAPIKARQDTYAIFILSNLIAPIEITRADKEIFSIMCMYLGQCLDNIKLFEELYHTKDELEKKVKERTKELVKSLRDVENISRMKSDFISSVSHELRTPLTSVKGFSSLLVDEKFGKLPPEAKKRLQKVDENVNKLVDMVNVLLDISRIESGKMEVKITPSDIVKIIRDVADLLTPQIQSKNLLLTLDVPESLTVHMDKHLIERVLINLINNAIKFTPENGKITVTCKKGPDHALISVSDTGFGIDKESLDKIFQEFYRVDNPVNREIRGSGLGLSLVNRIINTHKEKIWAESEVGRGTTFYFTLKL